MAGLRAVDTPLEEVIRRHLEARGGLANLRQVDSLLMTGTMTNEGPQAAEDQPITLAIRLPDLFVRRLETEPGVEMVQAIDGPMAWHTLPAAGLYEPAPMPEERARRFRRRFDIVGPLVDWQSKGHRVELLGHGQLDGRQVYGLHVAYADGESTTIYLDAETYLPLREYERTNPRPRRWMEAEIAYDDWRPAGGVMWPGTEIVTLAFVGSVQHFSWREIAVNSELGDDLFQKL